MIDRIDSTGIVNRRKQLLALKFRLLSIRFTSQPIVSSRKMSAIRVSRLLNA